MGSFWRREQHTWSPEAGDKDGGGGRKMPVAPACASWVGAAGQGKGGRTDQCLLCHVRDVVSSWSKQEGGSQVYTFKRSL